MKKTSYISRLFKFFWLSHCPTNKLWDELLNQLITKGNVTKVDDNFIIFDNKYFVWTNNHPYASGSLWKIIKEDGSQMNVEDYDYGDKLHCSKATKIRLEDFYYNYIEEHSEILKIIKADIRVPKQYKY